MRPPQRLAVTALLFGAATASASAHLVPPAELPEPALVFKTLCAVVGVVVACVVAVKIRRLGRDMRRLARSVRANKARLAELRAQTEIAKARSDKATQALLAARHIVSLLERLTEFLRDAPTWETPELALPKVDAFRRASGDAEARLGADAHRWFVDAADKAAELLALRGQLRQERHASRASTSSTQAGIDELVAWFAARAARVDEELAPLVLTRSGVEALESPAGH